MPTSVAISARKRAGRIPPASSVFASGRSALCDEGQYAQASVEANRSTPRRWCGLPKPYQSTPPSRVFSLARMVSFKRKKSTSCAYSCWTIAQAKRPVSSSLPSMQISPGTA